MLKHFTCFYADEDEDDEGELNEDDIKAAAEGTASKEAKAYAEMSSLVNYVTPVRWVCIRLISHQ